MRRPFDRRLLYGHRGAPARGLVENTLPSFARALADGANALETDVHVTEDGRVLVCHDPDLAGHVIARTTCAVLQALDLGGGARAPLLADVLDAFPDVPVNVDLKAPGIAAPVVQVVRAQRAEERVLLTSFHAAEVRAVRALGYAGPTGLARDEVVRLLALPSPFLRVWRLRGARAQVPVQSGRHRFDTERFLARAHALGVAVDYWVVNELAEARRLYALGADGVMSDDPGALAAALAADGAS